MSKKTTWADVSKGDDLDFGGRAWRVVKIKPRKPKKKGKKPSKADVMIEHKGRYSESVVALDERVTIAQKGDGTKRGPLDDAAGAQRRWATKKEADAAGVGLGAGKPEVTKPPTRPEGDVWETPHGKVERMLDDLLSARLVAEAKDDAVGYYVPPVDVSTVASHLTLFHGGIPSACEDEGAMMRAHEAQHAAAAKSEGILATNHWHSERRP